MSINTSLSESMPHEVAMRTPHFEAVLAGDQRHVLTVNPGGEIKNGDQLLLGEFDSEEQFTGRVALAGITSVTTDEVPCALSHEGIKPGFAIFSIALIYPE